jgi:hypothetical protein
VSGPVNNAAAMVLVKKSKLPEWQLRWLSHLITRKSRHLPMLGDFLAFLVSSCQELALSGG